MLSIKQLKEELYEADEVINELQIQYDIEKKNIDIITKKCNKYEIKINSLNNLLENAENDIYNKNIEIKQINDIIIDIKHINNQIKRNNNILEENIEKYKDKITDLEFEINIRENTINKLIIDNNQFEKQCIDNCNKKEDDDNKNELSLYDELYDELCQVTSEDTFFSISNKSDEEEIDKLKELNKCSQIRIIILRIFNFIYIILIIYLLYTNYFS